MGSQPTRVGRRLGGSRSKLLIVTRTSVERREGEVVEEEVEVEMISVEPQLVEEADPNHVHSRSLGHPIGAPMRGFPTACGGGPCTAGGTGVAAMATASSRSRHEFDRLTGSHAQPNKTGGGVKWHFGFGFLRLSKCGPL